MTASSLSVFRTVKSLRTQVLSWHKEGLSVGLVPTMGALHDGHMVLIEAAQAKCDRVIVSIFVNPTQFGKDEDFNTYPRDESFDRARLDAQDVDALYAPSVEDMFPDPQYTHVSLDHFKSMFEGVCRPGHLDGVATVVTKLLNQAQADHAFFGEKDFQQLQVITHMVRDLCMPTDIHGVPTVRHTDGLALSSRNVHMNDVERKQAPTLYKVLNTLSEAFQAGQHAEEVEHAARDTLAENGFGAIDYLAVVDANTLQPLKSFDPHQPARVLVAVRLGQTRLIDNIAIDPS